MTRETLQLDHVLPRSEYPEFKYDVFNLAEACDKCNHMKGSRTLEKIPEITTARLAEIYEFLEMRKLTSPRERKDQDTSDNSYNEPIRVLDPSASEPSISQEADEAAHYK
jgi:hypothetical protein